MTVNADFYDSMHASRVLIVDDDQDLANVVKKRFELEGYDGVDVAYDGKIAVDMAMKAAADRKPYELMILDLCLPGEVSGQDIYSDFCDHSDLCIVIISGVNATQEVVDALKSGKVEEYIVKPFDLEVLFLKCERVLSRQIFAKQVQRSHRRNQILFLNILQVMAKVLEAKDPYTKFHSENVAKYARQIAKAVRFDEHKLELIQIAGILHDFGKIGIKESVLNKPGHLTGFEYESVKRHPMIASAILEPIEELRSIIGDIKHHHEKWDGTGYPDGLAGEDIPLGARILCVADSYDAMTSSRAYHEPKSEQEAAEELTRCKGTQFDPDLVDKFLVVLEESRKRRERLIKLKSS